MATKSAKEALRHQPRRSAPASAPASLHRLPPASARPRQLDLVELRHALPDHVLHSRRVFVGKRTGPATWSSCSRAPASKSAQTVSSDFTYKLVSVILERRRRCTSDSRDFTTFAAMAPHSPSGHVKAQTNAG